MEATHKQKEFLHHNVAFLLVWISGSESSKRVSTNDSACYMLAFYHFFVLQMTSNYISTFGVGVREALGSAVPATNFLSWSLHFLTLLA